MFDFIEKQNYDESLNNHGSWLLYARQLMKAAGDIEELETDESRFLYPRIKLMLVAFAFENLIKAYIVKYGDSMASEGKLRKNLGRAHDLVALSARASLVLSDAEKDALRRLSYFGRFMGRYPNAATWNEVAEVVDGRAYRIVPWSNSSDNELLMNLFHRIHRGMSQNT